MMPEFAEGSRRGAVAKLSNAVSRASVRHPPGSVQFTRVDVCPSSVTFRAPASSLVVSHRPARNGVHVIRIPEHTVEDAPAASQPYACTELDLPAEPARA